MSCVVLSTPGAVFALWGRPTTPDLEQVLLAVQTAAEQCGHAVVYVTRVPTASPPPDAAARAALSELMPRLMKVCSTYHVVLEGDGFGAAVKRGILTGLFQLSWRRKTFFVHASVHEVARSVPPEDQPAVATLLKMAGARGLLSGPPPESLPPSASSRLHR
jgi:hypothetical protein